MNLKLEIKQAATGRRRWRWYIYDSRKRCRGLAPVQGFASRAEAINDARFLFGTGATLADVEGNELYAGHRDWE